MPKRIYVGNLPFSASDDEIRTMCERFGDVQSVRVSAAAGRTRVAEVMMGSDTEASRAISGLNGRQVGGNSLNVSEARPRQ